MRWQDGVFTVGGILFSIALIPTLLNPQSFVPRESSGLTAAVLSVYGVAFLSMKLKLSAASTLITAIVWWAIFIWRGGW